MARTHLVLSVIAGLALLAGCGAAPAAPARLVPAVAPVVMAQPRPVAVGTAVVAGLGAVLTTRDGRTLYLFAQDNNAPSLSTCLDACARKWPPLRTTGDVAVTGADRALVGTLVRQDGTTQVTVGGWPVYTSTVDTAPGRADGHGAQGLWFAVTPDGQKAGGAAPVAVLATDLPGFGPALTDRDGRTLYLFTLDGTDPSRSTCEGECAANWPPLLVTGEVEAVGVAPGLVGEVRRADGSRQVTVGGWPVYTHTGDTAPGATTGHGASDVWFVIEPAGCRSQAPATRPPAADPGTDTDTPDGSAGY